MTYKKKAFRSNKKWNYQSSVLWPKDGQELCLQLIAIGESVKNLDKITHKSLLSKYDGMDWKGVMGMRDIISHHYFDIDSDIIFNVCKTHIPQLRIVVNKILSDLQKQEN